MVSLPIILQLAEKEQYCIFQKKDFPSESSDDINPLLQKLNLAAVVFVQKQRLDITAHFLFYSILQHHAVYSQADSQTFSIVVYNKKDIGLTLP